MNKYDFSSEFGPPQGPFLILSENGELFFRETPESEWKFFDFNGMYDGYYPKCRFTALTYTNSFWLGGISESDGIPVLYNSVMGGVWSQRDIEMRSPQGGSVMPEGEIRSILWDSINRQLHLVMSSGQLITLPDCRKCVRIRRVADSVTGGRLEGRDCVLILPDGAELRTPLDDLIQLRVSWSWANSHIADGGIVLDLRTEAEAENDPLPWNALRMSIEECWEWLEAQPRDARIFVVCSRGLNSDVLTRLAHDEGYVNLWSLGGAEAGFHVD